MKNEIMAYITATINQYKRMGDGTCSLKTITLDLTDLENFVADLKEETTEKTDESIYVKRIVDLQEENEELCKKLKLTELDSSRERVRKTGMVKQYESIILKYHNRTLELEETCENMDLNEKKLHEKLKAYECNDVVWKNCYEALREENRKLTDGTIDKKHATK